MMYQFLTSTDVYDLVSKELLDPAIGDNKNNELRRAEAKAIEVIKSKLNTRLDLSMQFQSIPVWSATGSYSEGQYVWHSWDDEGTARDAIFLAGAAPATGTEPQADEANWSQQDPRNPLLVTHCAALTVYYVIMNINATAMPKYVKAAYKAANDWLNNVRDGVENPDLPEKVDGNDTIHYGYTDPNDMFP